MIMEAEELNWLRSSLDIANKTLDMNADIGNISHLL